jgi:hypothetical protein
VTSRLGLPQTLFAETTQQVVVHDGLKEQAATYQQRLKLLLQQDLAAFNALLRQRNVPNVIASGMNRQQGRGLFTAETRARAGLYPGYPSLKLTPRGTCFKDVLELDASARQKRAELAPILRAMMHSRGPARYPTSPWITDILRPRTLK